MKGIQRKTLFKCRDRLIVLLRLHVKLAQKVQRVGVPRIDSGNMFESVNGRRRLCKGPVGETEVVPGPRALRLTARRIEKNVARLGELLAVEQRDTFIQTRCKK